MLPVAAVPQALPKMSAAVLHDARGHDVLERVLGQHVVPSVFGYVLLGVLTNSGVSNVMTEWRGTGESAVAGRTRRRKSGSS